MASFYGATVFYEAVSLSLLSSSSYLSNARIGSSFSVFEVGILLILIPCPPPKALGIPVPMRLTAPVAFSITFNTSCTSYTFNGDGASLLFGVFFSSTISMLSPALGVFTSLEFLVKLILLIPMTGRGFFLPVDGLFTSSWD